MPPRVTPKHQRTHRTFIRAWREHRQLSQDQLVERVRERVDTFSKSTLSRLENGKQPYTQSTLEALAWALSCEPQDLLMRQPDSDFWSIIDTLQAMDPTEQAAALRVIQAMRKAS